MKNIKSIVAPVIMTLLGIIMILYGISNLFLSIVGTETNASINSSTYQKKHNSLPNTFTYTVSYTFIVNEKEYVGSGHLIKEIYGNPKGTIKIKYLSYYPDFNEPAKGISNNIIGMLIGGLILTILNILIIRQENKSIKNK